MDEVAYEDWLWIVGLWVCAVQYIKIRNRTSCARFGFKIEKCSSWRTPWGERKPLANAKLKFQIPEDREAVSPEIPMPSMPLVGLDCQVNTGILLALRLSQVPVSASLIGWQFIIPGVGILYK